MFKTAKMAHLNTTIVSVRADPGISFAKILSDLNTTIVSVRGSMRYIERYILYYLNTTIVSVRVFKFSYGDCCGCI